MTKRWAQAAQLPQSKWLARDWLRLIGVTSKPYRSWCKRTRRGVYFVYAPNKEGSPCGRLGNCRIVHDHTDPIRGDSCRSVCTTKEGRAFARRSQIAGNAQEHLPGCRAGD